MSVERDMLKIIGEIEEAVSFNMRADILSRPIALLMVRAGIGSWEVMAECPRL